MCNHCSFEYIQTAKLLRNFALNQIQTVRFYHPRYILG